MISYTLVLFLSFTTIFTMSYMKVSRYIFSNPVNRLVSSSHSMVFRNRFIVGNKSLTLTKMFSTSDLIPGESIIARCKRLLEKELIPSYCKVLGSNDDPNGSHIMIECISSAFEGKNMVQRQRLIYKALWDEMQSGRVHAVDGIIAKAPNEVTK